MSRLAPAQITVVDLSDDEGCLTAGGTAQLLDNKQVSAMYLTRHGDELHEALDVTVRHTTYSADRGQMEVLRTSNNIKAALEWYRQENSDVHFDVLNCDWDDLFEQIARAQGEHGANGAKKSQWYKYLWRKAGSKAEAVEPWLQLIPDEYGLSLLRGSIAIVFHMAEKSHLKEKAILDGFETITATIRKARSKGLSFHREPEMKACCQALYDCLTEGIVDLIWSLKPEGKGHNMIERFKNKQEKQRTVNIQAMLKRVHDKSIELDQCAERILAKQISETHQGTELLKAEASVTRNILVDVKTDQNNLLSVARDTRNGVEMVGRNIQFLGMAANQLAEKYDGVLETVLQQRLEYMNSDREQTQSSKEGQDGMLSMLAESIYSLQRQQIIMSERQEQFHRDIRRSLTPVVTEPRVRLGPGQFLDLLRVDPQVIGEDLNMVNTCRSRFDSRSMQQARSLVNERKFQNWVASRHGEILLVDGNDSATAHAFVSPMSVVCSQLTEALDLAINQVNNADNAIVCHFFCGLHKTGDVRVRGLRGMLRMLMCQLTGHLMVDEQRPVIDFGPDQQDNFLYDMEDGRMAVLVKALTSLLKKVPSEKTVYFIIDGVSAFEDDQFRAHLSVLIEDLHYLINNRDPTANGQEMANSSYTLKILLACHYRSVYLAPRGFIEDRDHATLEVGGRGGLSAMDGSSYRLYR